MQSEEDFEQVEAELVPSNELATIIKETALEPQLAEEFKINFEEHFRMASTWAKKAKKIIVTDASQTVVMAEARTARLFLRSKRLEIENFRVARKDYFLKGGRAIDKVANFLKDIIIPIETHLDAQEHFVELRQKAHDDKLLAEAKAKEEAEILKKQKEEKAELEKLRLEKIETMKKEAQIERAKLVVKQGSDLIKLQKIHDDLMNIDWPEMTGVKEKALRLEAMAHVNVGISRLEKYLKTVVTEEEI